MADVERPFKIRKLSASQGTQDPSMREETPGRALPEQTSESCQDEAANSDKGFKSGISDELEPVAEKQTGEEHTLSKSQRKKLLKRQAWDAGKDLRKAKRREKHKEKQTRKAEARAELEAKVANGEIEVVAPAQNLGTKGFSRPVQVPLTLILDCNFDDLMLDKEIISLASQVTRCHAENKKAPYRSHLVISSWSGRLRGRFETVLANTQLAWKGVRFLEPDFPEAAKEMDGVMRGPDGGKMVGALLPSGDEATITLEETHTPDCRQGESGGSSVRFEDPSNLPESTAPPSENAATPTTPELSVVYLSSDSPHTLDRLSPHTSYIIGGIVDKNRHKGLCYERACERGIPTAKLPIGEYMTMQSRSVLAVNHVVEIMLRWLETGDWGEAFLSVIPKRKEAKLKARRSKSESKESESEAESADEAISGATKFEERNTSIDA